MPDTGGRERKRAVEAASYDDEQWFAFRTRPGGVRAAEPGEAPTFRELILEY